MTLRLFVLAGHDLGRSFAVRDGDVLGRGRDCQVRLGDRSISRHHARIVLRAGRWTVEDLDSRNGLHVGGRRVRRAELSDHDEFLLGELPVRARLEDEGAPSTASATPYEEEIHLDPEPDPDPDPANRVPSERDRRRAAILTGGKRGLWTADLSQRPLWVRAGVLLFVLALAAGAFVVAYRSVQILRGAL